MVDPFYLVRSAIIATSTITNLLGIQAGQLAPGDGVYTGDLPEDFNPELGPGIQVLSGGGLGDSEITAQVDARVMIKVWARPNDQTAARNVFRAVYDLLANLTMKDFGSEGRILTCVPQDTGQDISDPPTGWACVLGIFAVKCIETQTQNYTPIS